VSENSVVAQGYDAVYQATARGKTFARLWKRHVAGADFPDDFAHISFVTLSDLRELASAMQLSPGSQFCDAACGMGGPGLWVANETRANLIGIDISPVAIEQAQKRASSLGLDARAKFAVGTFDSIGLADLSLDAMMTLDALQYAPDKAAAFAEFARILRPGARLAFCAFELDPEKTVGLPVIGDDPVSDYRPLLEASGFRVISYEQTPNWRERVTTAYSAVIEAQAAVAEEMGPIAAAALMSEMTLTLQRQIYCGRVFAVAERA
jgi:SAM-dependent methyltransferase